MEEQDKLFRQRIEALDTPPPQSQWTPGRSWERLEAFMQHENQPVSKWKNVGYYAAATVILLLMPIGLFLLRLDQPKPALTQSKENLTAAKLPEKHHTQQQLSKVEPIQKDSTERNSQVQLEHPKALLAQKKVYNAIKTTKTIPVEKEEENSGLTEPTHTIETTIAQPLEKVASTTSNPTREETGTRQENVKAYLLQSAPSGGKYQATSVTIHFPGNNTEPVTTLSQDTPEPRRKRIMKVLTNHPLEESLKNTEEPANIFSILTEKN